jgi:hypothetical protein
MKLKNIIPQRYRSQIVRLFGDAKLICHSNGSHELIGGTADDHTAAREWCSLFAQEVVFSGTPRRNPVIAFAE